MWRRLPACCVLVLACAARPVDDGDGGVTTNIGETAPSESDSASADVGSSTDSSSSSTDSSSGSTDSSSSGTDSSSGDGDGDACVPPPKLDLPPDPDPPLPDACTVELVDWADLDSFPGCVLCNDATACAHQLYLACVALPLDTSCSDLCPSGNCAGFGWSICTGMLDGWSDQPDDWCGPYEIDGRCCTLGRILWVCAE